MDFTFYDENTGEIRFVVSSPDLPAPENGAYVEGKYDAKIYRIVNGQPVEKPSYEIEQKEIEGAWVRLRNRRNKLLDGSDWTQVPDAPADAAAWATYRQALRELPANTIDPRNPVWPTPPST